MSESITHLDRLRRQIVESGLTGDEASWLLKALHPPAPGPKVAIPDETYVPAVMVDYRPSIVISAPPTLAQSDTWDLCIIAPPGNVTAAMWAGAQTGADFGSTGPLPDEQLGFMTFQPHTRQYPAGGISLIPITQGLIEVPPLEYYTDIPSDGTIGFRTSYRSITAELTASSLSNQGTVYACQIPPNYRRVNELTTPGDVYPSLAVPVLINLPLVEDSITIMAPGSYVGPAREGVYLPARLAGPTQPFALAPCPVGLDYTDPRVPNPEDPGAFAAAVAKYPAVEFSSFGQLAAYNPLTCQSLPFVTSQIDNLSPLSGVMPVGWVARILTNNGTPARYGGDTGFDNVATSVIIFRGLDSRASVTLRVYCGLESLPTDISSVRPFTQAPANPSPLALKLYHEIASKMAYAYPARYNLFGSLMPLITSALASLAPYARDAAKAGFASMVKRFVESRPVPLAPAALAAAPAAKNPRPNRGTAAKKRRN